MSRYIWIQLTKEIKPRESIRKADGKAVSGTAWLKRECQRINTEESNALIYDLGEKGGAIFVRVQDKFRGKTEASLSEVEREITEKMENGK